MMDRTLSRGRGLLAAMFVALAPCAAPAAHGQPAGRAEAQRGLEGDDEYLVRPGETLNGIAARLLREGETRRMRRALAQHNRLSDAEQIQPGQILHIPRSWLKSRPLLPAPFLWSGVRLVPHSPESLAFSALKGARSYRVLLSASEGFRPVLAEAVVETPEVRLSTLTDGDYFIRVRGIDDVGLEGRGAVARLRVRTHADPPRPASPPDRSRIYGATVEFVWLADPGASSYTLQIARDPAFRALAGQWAGLREPRYAAGGLAPGEYYWRIASSTADGRSSLYSEPRALSVRPEPPLLNAPKLEVETLGLSWPARPGQRFELQMAADAAFILVVEERHTEEPYKVLPRPAPGTYYIRVRATDPDGTVGPYTAARVLLVPAKGPKPACLVDGPAGICAVFGPQPAAPR